MSQYIIYCRKSTESEERQVLSIDSQIKELKALASRLRLNVSEVLTESKSAKQPGRPVFNALMKRVYKNDIKGIIAWKLDRLARNPIDGSSLVWALDQGKLSQIVTPQGTFLNEGNSKLMMQIEFGMAKKYIDDLSDNVKRGNRAKLERGWLPAPAPLGYLNETREKTIIKDPERFSAVQKMWGLLLQGFKPAKILAIANDQWGFRTRLHKKVGGKPLSLSGMYKIFSNPFYYGLLVRKEGVYLGKHEAMISEQEYQKAQEILGRPGKARPQKHDFAFTGMIRCGECDCMITAEEKKNRYGYHYAYYRCTKKKKNHPCAQQYINAKKLEEQIIEYLKRIHIHKKTLALAIDYLEDERKREKGGYHNARLSLQKEITNCEIKLKNLNQMRLRELIDDDEYLREKEELLNEKIRLANSLNNDDSHQDSFALTRDALSFANQAADRFHKGTPEEKKLILQKIGSNFFLRDQKLLIQAKKVYQIIENNIGGVKDNLSRLEPPKKGLFETKNGPSLPQIESLHTAVDQVRTFYEKEEGINT